MKILRPVQLVLGALLPLLFLASLPAQAQSGWQLDHYECSGASDGGGVHTLWPATVPAPGPVTFRQYGGSAQCVGTISAVFTWQGGGQPSDSLTVLISSSAAVYGTLPQPDPDNGLQDPATSNSTPGAETSSGSHVVKVHNSGYNTTVKTDVYSLSAICGPAADAAGDTAAIDFQVHTTNASLEGHSTADTAGWDPSAPRFFSGTACTARGVAVALSGNVAHAQLCIGSNGDDTIVNEYHDMSAVGGTGAASVALNAMFDSTHFKDKTKIKLTLKVWDTNSGYYEIEVTGLAYNKAFVLLNNTAESSEDSFGVGRVVAALKLMHHAVPPGAFDKYHRDAVLKALPANTVCYVDTHASQNDFGDSYCGYEAGTFDNTCKADTENPFVTDSTGRSMYHVDITHSVSTKNNVQPPYNLVFIDGCETAGETASPISNILSNAFGVSGSARCFIGWHNEVFAQSTENINWKIRFWDNLRYGNSVWIAIEKATIDGDPLGEGTRGIATSETEVYPVMVGDWATKLHGVYRGKGTAWYIPL